MADDVVIAKEVFSGPVLRSGSAYRIKQAPFGPCKLIGIWWSIFRKESLKGIQEAELD